MNGDNISENEIARRLENAKNQAKESRARTNRIKKKLIILLSCIIVVGVILFCTINFVNLIKTIVFILPRCYYY